MTLIVVPPAISFVEIVRHGGCWSDDDLRVINQIITLSRVSGPTAAASTCWLLAAAAPDLLAIGRGLMLAGRPCLEGKVLLEHALAQAVQLAGELTMVPFCSVDYEFCEEEWSVGEPLTERRQRALCLISEALAVGREVPVELQPVITDDTLVCEVGIRARMSPLARALARMMPAEEVPE